MGLLSKYNQKRNFRKTPEPAGKAQKSAAKGLRFVIQKHDASHLHYDFRLEMQGVMKSWAIPKGPSLNPADKRLAVMTEDHPISYNVFEGQIPQGNYGAGDVIVWDNGTYHAINPDGSAKSASESEKDFLKGLHAGSLTFVLDGKKLQGEFTLVRMKDRGNSRDGKNWILIKKQDAYADERDLTAENNSVLSNRTLTGRNEKLKPPKKGRAKIPKVTPMLATLVDEPFDSDDWIFEIKYDGYRAMGAVKNGKVNLYSRNDQPFNDKYPEIVEALSEIQEDVLLDGEIIAFGSDGKASFQTLQNSGVDKVHREYVIFDLLYLNGVNLMTEPLIERKKLLQALLEKYPQSGLTYSDHIESKGKAFFKAAVAQDLEGIMAKRKSGAYLPGVRGDDWLKIKHHHTDEAVIVGFTEPRGSRHFFGALVLGQYKSHPHKSLTFIGHTGTGFDDATLRSLHAKMLPLVNNKSPFKTKVPINSPITWIRPKLVAQLKFAQWTKDNIMRQPVFLGLREDKAATAVTKEKTAATKDKTMPRPQSKKNRPNTDQLHTSQPNTNPEITNPDKIYFPKLGYTKGDLINYYEKIAPTMLPYLKDRPQSLNRHPNGVDKPNFYQKNLTAEPPEFVETFTRRSDSTNKDVRYLVCQNKETLLYEANLGCIEINPWSSRVKSMDRPDFMVIDLDPGNNTLAQLIKVAQEVHKVLEESCEQSYVKTSGKTGIHIFIPLGAKYDFDQIRTFAELIANIVHRRLPKITSIERSPAKRKNLIYLDFLQNSLGQTLAAPYSVRPTEEATVSTPLKWSEVKTGLDPKKFTIKTIFKRLDKYGDLWKGILKDSVDLKESISCLQKSQEKLK